MCVCVCACALTHIQLFATSGTLGSSVQGISQARILEWVTISFSGGLYDPGIKPTSPVLQADSLLLSHRGN